MAQLNKSDPLNLGSCDKSSHGKMWLVKNKSGDEKVIICVSKDAMYLWKSLDGM